MHTSKIVEVDGVFIGAAVLLPEAQGWRFVAADHRADAADGRTAPTLHDAQQLAKRAFFTSRSRALAPATSQDMTAGAAAVGWAALQPTSSARRETCKMNDSRP